MRAWMLSLCAGIALCALVSRLPSVPLLVIVVLASLLCLLPGNHSLRCLSGLLLGIAWGCFYGSHLMSDRLDTVCEKQQFSLVGQVTGLPRRSRMPDGSPRQRFEFVLSSSLPAYCASPRRILLSYYGESAIQPGEHWRFELILQRPWGLANPGSFNMQSWFAQTGIDAVGRVRGQGDLLQAGADGWSQAHNRLRYSLAQQIKRLRLPASAEAILLAITVADRSGIDSALWGQLQQFGLNHLVVISGLHIGLVAASGLLLGRGVSYLVLVLLGSRLWLPAMPALCALLFAFFYTALAGFSVSTSRALIMLACFVVARLLSRTSSPWNSLLIAASLILVLNPLAVLGSGTWLSFSAVACLLWLGQWWPRLRWPARLCATHLFMALAMVPLGSWWFGGFSAVSALANMVLVPAVGLYLVPLALLGVVFAAITENWAAVIWRWAVGPVPVVLAGLSDVTDSLADLLFIHWHTELLPLVLALLAIACLVSPLPRWRYGVTALLVLPLALVPASPGGSNAVLTVLDVGQGTSVVVRTPERTLVYDTGGGDPAGITIAQSVVLPFLRSRGIQGIDELVISHSDADHSAGLGAINRAMPVTQLWVSTQQELDALGHGRLCRAGLSWRWPEGITFQFLSPGSDLISNSNDHSCVLQIDIRGRRFLLPGDISASQERELARYWRQDLHSNWLLAGHHGSNTSSSHTWLKFVQPQETVFSRGYASRFGHPHQAVVRRFSRRGVDTTDTAYSGAVEYILDESGGWQRRQWRQFHKRYWMQ